MDQCREAVLIGKPQRGVVLVEPSDRELQRAAPVEAAVQGSAWTAASALPAASKTAGYSHWRTVNWGMVGVARYGMW